VDVALKAQDIARLGAALTFQVKSGDAMLGTIDRPGRFPLEGAQRQVLSAHQLGAVLRAAAEGVNCSHRHHT
jgi:hypothetical protein